MRSLILRLISALALGCLLWGVAAWAMTPMERKVLLSGQVAFHGPGSPGFLPTCSSNFSVTNLLLQSQTFINASWSKAGIGTGSAPTITANTALAPDGTMTASTLSLPSVSGAGNGSVLSQAVTGSVAQFPFTGDIYIQGTVGGETLSVMMTATGAAGSYATKTITLPDATTWVLVGTTQHNQAANQFFEVGVDLRDSSQNSHAAQSVHIWAAQVVGGRAGRTIFNYIPTTTAQVTQVQNINCPNGVAFRDFSNLALYSGNPITPQNTGAYNAGGVANPFINSAVKTGGAYYALTNCTPSGVNRNNWPNQCLYSGGPLSWVDYSAGNPVITATASAWDDHYLLHPAMVQSCGAGVWCAYISAMTSANHSSIGLWTSTNLTTWTPSASNPVVPPTIGSLVLYPSIPSVTQTASLRYLFSSTNDNSGLYTIYWTSPLNDGVAWTFAGTALNPAISGDWDYSVSNPSTFIDSFVWKNSHGFYEMFYTAYQVSLVLQRVGYAVAPTPDGPWFKYQTAPIVTPTTAGCPADYFGDAVAFEDGANFILSGNCDDGSALSYGLALTMPDHYLRSDRDEVARRRRRRKRRDPASNNNTPVGIGMVG